MKRTIALARRVRVDIHHHDTRTWTRHRLTFARLLAVLERARRQAPPLTVCLGDAGRCIAIATEPADGWTGHHGLADAGGAFLGVMTYRDLTLADVRRILIAFYSGCREARCFAGREGEFVPDDRRRVHAR